MDNQNKKEIKRRGRPCKAGKEPKTSKSCASGGGGGAAKKELRKDYNLLVSRKQGESDACDCFIAECPGCWYPCETCGSTKCSTFCRTISRDEQLQWEFFN